MINKKYFKSIDKVVNKDLIFYNLRNTTRANSRFYFETRITLILEKSLDFSNISVIYFGEISAILNEPRSFICVISEIRV